MSLIVSEVYDALLEAGTSEEKARAAAGAIPLAERMATKEDLDGLKALFKEDLDGLKARIDDRFSRIDERFTKIERDLGLLKFGYGPAILALLVKIAFF